MLKIIPATFMYSGNGSSAIAAWADWGSAGFILQKFRLYSKKHWKFSRLIWFFPNFLPHNFIRPFRVSLHCVRELIFSWSWKNEKIGRKRNKIEKSTQIFDNNAYSRKYCRLCSGCAEVISLLRHCSTAWNNLCITAAQSLQYFPEIFPRVSSIFVLFTGFVWGLNKFPGFPWVWWPIYLDPVKFASVYNLQNIFALPETKQYFREAPATIILDFARFRVKLKINK